MGDLKDVSRDEVLDIYDFLIDDHRHFFTCYFGKDPNKLGCPEGQVFDTVSQQCKEAEEVLPTHNKHSSNIAHH